MKERHLTEVYTNSFHKFLTHTDEKRVLLEEITKRVLGNGAHSLLDIGAGNGDLAIPLSRLVENYVAIEHKPDYIKSLRSAGLKVIDKFFPFDIEERFDFILASHSIPWKKEEYEPFIKSAIDVLTNHGLFLGITFNDEKSYWKETLMNCGLVSGEYREGRLSEMEEWLSNFNFSKEVVTTYVRTISLEDMLEALAFVYSDGDGKKIEEFLNNTNIRRYLGENNKNNDGYFFPFDHIFLEIRKSI